MATCMELLSGAWTPDVVWKLSGGPRRFGELRRDIPTISPKMLTVRLRGLEDRGVAVRHVIPSSPPSVEYALSELGRELLPVIDAMVKVGTRLRAAALRDGGRKAAEHGKSGSNLAQRAS
jgi:DNA-binding HxlR family transcriptional regulator